MVISVNLVLFMGMVMSDARLAEIEQRIEAMQGRDEWRGELATARSELGATVAELRNEVADLRSELTELGREVGTNEADARSADWTPWESVWTASRGW